MIEDRRISSHNEQRRLVHRVILPVGGDGDCARPRTPRHVERPDIPEVELIGWGIGISGISTVVPGMTDRRQPINLGERNPGLADRRGIGRTPDGSIVVVRPDIDD